MVATSLVDPNATSSPSLFARIRGALRHKSPANDAHASHPNEDASRAAQGSANTQEASPVCLLSRYHVPCDERLFPIRCSKQTMHLIPPARGVHLMVRTVFLRLYSQTHSGSHQRESGSPPLRLTSASRYR